jgi:stage V sporulation protein B
MKKQSFLKGSSVLIASVIIAKAISALFKIPLTNILGGIGIGYFSSAYGLFLPLYAITSVGLTTAIAKLTADNITMGRIKNARRIKKVSLIGFTIIGILGTLAVIIAAKPFALFAVNSPKSYLSIITLSPSILFGCITAIYRGYFEGAHNFTPTAISQIIEAAVKLLTGLLLCIYAVNMNYPTEIVSAFAVGGVTLSTFAGLVYTVIKCRKDDLVGSDNYIDIKRVIAKSIWKIFLPVAIGALVTNLTSLIDLMTIMRGLDKAVLKSPESFAGIENYSELAYGAFLGMSVVVFNLVPCITNMFGKSIFPSIAEANIKNDKDALKKHIENVLFATMFIAAPAGLGIFILSKPILLFLFTARQQEVEIAYSSLSYLGIAVILCCITYPVFSILQAIGRVDLPLKIMLTGVIVKLVSNLILIPLPKYGINGAAIGTVLSYTVITVISFIALRKVTNVKINSLRVIWSPLYAGLLCGITAMLTYSFLHYLPNHFALPVSILIGGAIFIFSSWLMSLQPTADVFRESPRT